MNKVRTDPGVGQDKPQSTCQGSNIHQCAHAHDVGWHDRQNDIDLYSLVFHVGGEYGLVL